MVNTQYAFKICHMKPIAMSKAQQGTCTTHNSKTVLNASIMFMVNIILLSLCQMSLLCIQMYPEPNSYICKRMPTSLYLRCLYHLPWEILVSRWSPAGDLPHGNTWLTGSGWYLMWQWFRPQLITTVKMMRLTLLIQCKTVLAFSRVTLSWIQMFRL